MERLFNLIYRLSPIKLRYDNKADQSREIVQTEQPVNDGTDYFTLLPIELIDKILEFCDDPSLSNMGDVNLDFQDMIYGRHRYIGIDFSEVANKYKGIHATPELMSNYINDLFSVINGLKESEKEELTSLNIKNHTLNVPYVLEVICKKAENIKYIDVNNCGLDDRAIKKIFPELIISNDRLYFGFRYFPNLVTLDISYNEKITSHSIALIIDNCPKLSKFIGKGLININCLSIFQEVKDLEYLDVSHCIKLRDIPEFLKNTNNRKLKALFLNGLGIHHETKVVENNTQLLSNLDTFGFNLSHNRLKETYEYIISKLSTNLRSLNIGDKIFAEFLEDTSKFSHNVIEINKGIEKLCIGNDIQYSIQKPTYFQNLKSLYPNLKELVIHKLWLSELENVLGDAPDSILELEYLSLILGIDVFLSFNLKLISKITSLEKLKTLKIMRIGDLDDNLEIENHNYIDNIINTYPNIKDIEFINCLLSSDLNEDMRLKTEYLEKVKQKNLEITINMKLTFS